MGMIGTADQQAPGRSDDMTSSLTARVTARVLYYICTLAARSCMHNDTGHLGCVCFLYSPASRSHTEGLWSLQRPHFWQGRAGGKGVAWAKSKDVRTTGGGCIDRLFKTQIWWESRGRCGGALVCVMERQVNEAEKLLIRSVLHHWSIWPGQILHYRGRVR